MRPYFIAIFSGILLLYGFLNYYIGLRGWQALGQIIPFFNGKLYWVIFWISATGYILARFTERFMPEFISHYMTLFGSYWLAAMTYFFFILLCIDAIKFLDRWLHFIPSAIKGNPVFSQYLGLAVLAFVVVLLAYGNWNARHPKVTHYDVTIAKNAGNLKNLHVVMVSDIHLGAIINNGRLIKMVDDINALKPDIVLLPGDLIDEDVGQFIEQKMHKTFQGLKAKYGVYAALGNHEYIGGRADDAAKYLTESGVQVLRDQVVKVGESFYVVGRDNISHNGASGGARVPLDKLLAGVDKSLPIIALDHQPQNLGEPQKAGVDLQVSGHTHHGQFFPFNLITERIFEKDYGYLRKGEFQLLVSSGFGTWGPPVRIGNVSEIVDINITFK